MCSLSDDGGGGTIPPRSFPDHATDPTLPLGAPLGSNLATCPLPRSPDCTLCCPTRRYLNSSPCSPKAQLLSGSSPSPSSCRPWSVCAKEVWIFV